MLFTRVSSVRAAGAEGTFVGAGVGVGLWGGWLYSANGTIGMGVGVNIRHISLMLYR